MQEPIVKFKLTSVLAMQGTKVREVNYSLEISKNLDTSAYLIAGGIPTPEGFKVIKQILIQTLATQIKYEKENKMMEVNQNIEYIQSEIKRSVEFLTKEQ